MRGVRPHRAIDVKPRVHHAHVDQPIDPLLVDQIVDVRLAHAGADAGEDLVLEAILDALHRFRQHAVPAAALIADDLGPFDADERRDVAELAHLLARFLGDEMAVGEDLEIAIGMRLQQLEQLRVHERLAADDAEEDVAHLLGFADHACETPPGSSPPSWRRHRPSSPGSAGCSY